VTVVAGGPDLLLEGLGVKVVLGNGGGVEGSVLGLGGLLLGDNGLSLLLSGNEGNIRLVWLDEGDGGGGSEEGNNKKGKFHLYLSIL